VTIHVVECPRCFKAKWHATGLFNVNRHKLRRAECVCESCGYMFSSGRPEAITAGELIRGPEEIQAIEGQAPDPPVRVPQPSLPHARVLQQPSEFTAVGSLVKDFKRLQAGEDE